MKKFINILICLTFIGTISLILLMGIWLNYPYKPLVVNTINVITKEIKQGEYFVYDVDFCKNTDKPAEISRSFVDGVLFNTPSGTVNNPKGCYTNRITLLVPNLPAGTYFLKIHYSYEVNPIRTINLDIVTESFKIIE